MRVVKPGEKLSEKELRYFANMAGKAYVNDPVHSYATKNIKRREKVVSHFMMQRLKASNGTDYFYIDDENRGICVWRRAHNDYKATDFFKLPDWFYLYWYWPNSLKTFMAYSLLDVKVFDENCWIISPVFVSPDCQGQGIATALIKKGMEDLSKMGYTFGLEAQSDSNVAYYKKLGFEITGEAYYKRGDIHHYYMVLKP